MSNTKFFDVLADEGRIRTVGRRCDLALAFAQMPDDLAEEVRGALGDPLFTAAAISRTLNRFSYQVTEGAVRRCRRTCNCWKVDAVA